MKETWNEGYMERRIHGTKDTWIHGMKDTWNEGYME